MVAKRFVVGLSCGILVLAVSLFAVLENASQNIIKDEKLLLMIMIYEWY